MPTARTRQAVRCDQRGSGAPGLVKKQWRMLSPSGYQGKSPSFDLTSIFQALATTLGSVTARRNPWRKECFRPLPEREERPHLVEEVVGLDDLARHVGGDPAVVDPHAADAKELGDGLVQVFFRQVTQARVVNEVERVVREWQLADVAVEIAFPPFSRRLGMDIRGCFRRPRP